MRKGVKGVFIGRLRRPCALVLVKRSYTNIFPLIHDWVLNKRFCIWPYTITFRFVDPGFREHWGKMHP